MSSLSVFLYETGLSLGVPTLNRVPSCDFPFWADYSVLDFHLSSFSYPDLEKHIILEGEYRRLTSLINSRWGHEDLEILPVTGDFQELVDILQDDTSDQIILVSVSTVIHFSFEELLPILRRMRKSRLIKVSVDGAPADVYLAHRTHLIELIKSHESMYRSGQSVGSFLFERVLHTSFDTMENIPGTVLFQSNLMQMYHRNIELLHLLKDPDFAGGLFGLEHGVLQKTDSYIGENASVRGSYLGTGVEIHGQVEGSVIFHGVTVKPKTRIINSVIMSHNQIGSQVEIINTLVLPYRKEVMKGVANIAHEAAIGGRSSTAVNEDYPDQIYDGITVLGVDVEIPARYRIEPACYVAGGVPGSVWKRSKILKRGSSVVPNTRLPESSEV